MRKPAHYRRALHSAGDNVTLERALQSCRGNYPDGQFAVFPYTQYEDCIVASHNQVRGREILHLVVFEEGAGAAVINTLRDIQIDEQVANSGEFIQSQVFLICSAEHVIYVTHNQPLRDSRISVLLSSLVRSFGGFQEHPAFLLEASLDEERYRDLLDDGIGEIDLGVGGFQQTLEYVLQGGHVDRGGLFSVLRSIAGGDRSEEEREAASKVSGRFVLKPGRDWSDVHVKELMTDMALNLLDEEDHEGGFAIVTKSGLRITQDAVRLKDEIRVDGNRRVLDAQQVFDALDGSFREFVEMGLIE